MMGRSCFSYSLATLLVVCFITGALSVNSAFAQFKPGAGVNFIVGVPVAEFAENIDNVGFGIGFNGGVGLAPAPVMVGVDLGYLLYGYEETTQPFSNDEPDFTILLETTNSIAFGHIFFRVQPQRGWFQPYAEALFGLKYLFTTVTVKDEYSDERIDGSDNFDDWTASYGVGAGLDVKVFEAQREGRRPYQLHLNAGARYLLGGSASYLDRGATSRVDGDLVFDVSRSRTDLIMPQLGVSFAF